LEKQKMEERLIDDICNYIDYLQGDPFGYRITLHQTENHVGTYFYRFLRYNYHDCQVCKEIKNFPRAWQHCIDRQEKVKEAAGRHPILGTCYAGVTEYVFPLYAISGRTWGFICFSGFSQNPKASIERACAAAARFKIPKEKLVRAVNSLDRDIPDFDMLSAQAAPLQNMFTLLFHLMDPEHDISASNPKEAIYLKMSTHMNHSYPNPDFSLKELADKMNLNYSYVSHIFSKYSKASFSSRLRSLRIEAAKKYLEYTDDTVSMIASAVGFNDSNYFSHIFLTETGLTPTQWRHRYLEQK
jgi:AraC-like DNA-binding protein